MGDSALGRWEGLGGRVGCSLGELVLWTTRCQMAQQVHERTECEVELLLDECGGVSGGRVKGLESVALESAWQDIDLCGVAVDHSCAFRC